jgi:hypothetical protein
MVCISVWLRRAARRVEPRQPHRAHEYDPQRVVGVLELLVEARLALVHPPPVRLDVEPEFAHLCDLVLAGGHDQRHVGRLQDLQLLRQPLPLCLVVQ